MSECCFVFPPDAISRTSCGRSQTDGVVGVSLSCSCSTAGGMVWETLENAALLGVTTDWSYQCSRQNNAVGRSSDRSEMKKNEKKEADTIVAYYFFSSETRHRQARTKKKRVLPRLFEQTPPKCKILKTKQQLGNRPTHTPVNTHHHLQKERRSEFSETP